MPNQVAAAPEAGLIRAAWVESGGIMVLRTENTKMNVMQGSISISEVKTSEA